MCTVFGMGRLSNAPIVRECACVDVDLYMNVYSVRRGRPERCTYCAWVRGRGRARCTCTCTVVDVDSLNVASVVRGCVSVGAYTVLELVQCAAWTA